jgi:hypothetical protein
VDQVLECYKKRSDQEMKIVVCLVLLAGHLGLIVNGTREFENGIRDFLFLFFVSCLVY